MPRVVLSDMRQRIKGPQVLYCLVGTKTHQPCGPGRTATQVQVALPLQHRARGETIR